VIEPSLATLAAAAALAAFMTGFLRASVVVASGSRSPRP
jgi:hypothetical protein